MTLSVSVMWPPGLMLSCVNTMRPDLSITYDTRAAMLREKMLAASYAWITFDCASAATANWLRQASTEKRLSVSILSLETPITVAPSAWKRGVASAKALASMVQPLV